MRVNRKICQDYERSSHLEWLETNGTGGFAMGTVAGTNTRRYHGLLVASLRPPVDRHVLLSRLDEVVSGEGAPDAPLATNQYPGTLAPRGYAHLVEFRLDPFPTWVFDVGGAHVEKQLFLVPGEQSVVVTYRATRPRKIAISPFLAFRDYHSLSRANPSLDGSLREDRNGGALVVRARPYGGLPELALHVSPEARLERDGTWYYSNEYLAEIDRGLDFREDLWKLGTLHAEIAPDKPLFVAATIGPRTFDANSVADLTAKVSEQRRPRGADPFLARLEAAADQFVVRRADGKPTVIAGYPWFTDWGRDTMISLPGLLIARGRLQEAREVLRGFLAHIDRGLIPNAFPDRSGDKPEYNTVDATLWYVEAVRAYHAATGDDGLLEALYPGLEEIVRWHREGTRYGIKEDPTDGLLTAGAPGVQLTWMDAKAGDRIVTPRRGKAIEINALWYNALHAMRGFARRRRRPVEPWDALAARVRAGFERFWSERAGHCYDVIDGPDGNDDTLRPNQIIAVSLPESALPAARQRMVVDACARHLLTSYGLRSLAPSHPEYRGHYGGDQRERAGAYHQGTAWAWLLGPFALAHHKVYRDAAVARSFLEPLADHLADYGVGSVAEIFDGDPPFTPRGCVAQAWSVGETLRAWHALAASR